MNTNKANCQENAAKFGKMHAQVDVGFVQFYYVVSEQDEILTL